MRFSLSRVILGICMLAVLLSVASSAVEESPPTQVLILASYHPGMKWEDSIDSEIKLRFAMRMPSAIFSIEYMDTKRIAPNETRLADLRASYLKKYNDKHFDLIVSTNTDAFNFLLENRDDIFPGTPVVFCGVINFDDKMLEGRSGFTGVVEAYDIANTLSLMLQQNPNARHIAIVTDKTITGLANRRVVDKEIAYFKENVSFEYLDDLSADELRERVANLPLNSLILLMTFNRDRNGKVLTYEDSSEMIREASLVPIYSVYDFYLGYGVMGGKMISGKSQGDQAADLALRILQGEAADKIPVSKKSPNQYMFDMFELHRFGIDQSSLPPDSEVINQPFKNRTNLVGMNLSGLDLADANLSRAELQESNLTGTNLKGAYLTSACMQNARLVRADISNATMEDVDLYQSDLSGAILRNANLIGSNLIGSNLTGADMTGADLGQARASRANLAGAKMDGQTWWPQT